MQQVFTFLFVLCLWSNLQAQTTHNVSVGNLFFDPAIILIDVGDEVVWTNTQGVHNVNGLAADFPDNPEPFGNPSDGSGNWVYSFTFTLPGTYAYECGVHGANMSGNILVKGTTSISENGSEGEELKVFPVPTQEMVTFKHADGIKALALYDGAGKVVLEREGGNAETIVLSTTSIAAGTYICIVQSSNGAITQQKLVVE